MIKTFNAPAFKHNKRLTGIVFLIVFSASMIIGALDFLYQMDQENHELEGMANQCQVYERFQELEALHSTEYCALLLLSCGYDETEYRKSLQEHLLHDRYIDGAAFARNGIIDRVAYSKLLGHIDADNLLENQATKEAAIWSRDHGMPVHIHTENSYSIVISPMYQSVNDEEYDSDGRLLFGGNHRAENFIGFVVVGFSQEAFGQNQGVLMLRDQGISYEIYKKQPWQKHPVLIGRSAAPIHGLVAESSDSARSIVDWERAKLGISQAENEEDYIRVVAGRESKLLSNGSYIVMVLLGAFVAFLLTGALLAIYWLIYENSQYRRSSMRDVLTGCFNRRRFAIDVKKLLDKSSRFAICYIDLDKLKSTNDAYGHEAGDELLTGTVKLIEGCLDGSGRLYRLGGDEFAIIFSGIKQDFSVEKQNRILQRSMETPIQINGQYTNGSFSAGFVVYPDDGTEYEELLRIADKRMYEAKRQKQNDHCQENEPEYADSRG